MKRRDFLKGLLAIPAVAFIPTVFAKIKNRIWHNSQIIEIITFNKAHSPEDIEGIQSYLGKKHRVPGKFGKPFTEADIEKLKPVYWMKP